MLPVVRETSRLRRDSSTWRCGRSTSACATTERILSGCLCAWRACRARYDASDGCNKWCGVSNINTYTDQYINSLYFNHSMARMFTPTPTATWDQPIRDQVEASRRELDFKQGFSPICLSSSLGSCWSRSQPSPSVVSIDTYLLGAHTSPAVVD
jgi:hypothetical protein